MAFVQEDYAGAYVERAGYYVPTPAPLDDQRIASKPSNEKVDSFLAFRREVSCGTLETVPRCHPGDLVAVARLKLKRPCLAVCCLLDVSGNRPLPDVCGRVLVWYYRYARIPPQWLPLLSLAPPLQ